MTIFNKKEFQRDVLTRRRIDMNISMEVACAEIGISKATLSRIENGKTPEIDTFLKICDWLGVNNINKYFIDDFEDPLDGDDPRTYGLRNG